MEEIKLEDDILVLALGSNLGNRKQLIETAYVLIEAHLGSIIKKSSFLENQPVGFDSEEPFLNTCIALKCHKDAFEVLHVLKRIESDLGRIKTKDSYEDRLIDIDIIFFGQRIIETPLLNIPHNLYRKREFVVKPLLELSNFQDPKSGKFISDITF